MRLTLYSDYALRVLMHAALRRPDVATIDEAANSFRISRNHLVKVVQALGQHGFLSTRRGIGGGFTLGLPPENIRLGDVIRLTESDESVIDCVDKNDKPCRIFPVCRLKGVLDEAAAAFFEVLDRYSVDDLVKRQREMRKLLRLGNDA
jgi:Rrf2 family transcriptional regulator, nitric oxide-sensitive transcriptional repressor